MLLILKIENKICLDIFMKSHDLATFFSPAVSKLLTSLFRTNFSIHPGRSFDATQAEKEKNNLNSRATTWIDHKCYVNAVCNICCSAQTGSSVNQQSI